MSEIKSKFIIGCPYEMGTPEWGNLDYKLKEIVEDNNGYTLKSCIECEECGVINDTVEEYYILKNGIEVAVMLCDCCANELPEMD